MANFLEGFARGFGKTFDPEAIFSAMYTGAAQRADVQRELLGQQKLREFMAMADQEIGQETARIQKTRAGNQMTQDLERQLAATDPGSSERKAVIAGLPPPVQKNKGLLSYFLTADSKQLNDLSQSVLEGDDFGTDQLKEVLTNPQAFGQAIAKASEASRARGADPQGYGFQLQMRHLGAQQQKTQRAIDRAWQVYTQMPAGTAAQDAMEKMISGFQQKLSALEVQRNNLSSPQFETFAQGQQNVTQFVDPSSGELIQVGAAEAPVYVQQRGQAERQALSLAQQAGQFQQSEARQAGQFAAREAATESRFLRTPPPAGATPTFPTEGEIEYTRGGLEEAGQAEALAAKIAGKARLRAKASGISLPEAIDAEIAALPEVMEEPGLFESVKNWFLGSAAVTRAGKASYPSAEAVRSAFRAGRLSEAEATKILRSEFGME